MYKKRSAGLSQQNVNSNRNKKKRKLSDYYVLAIGIAVLLLIVIGIINGMAPKNYYLKEIKIVECSVIQKTQEDGKNYIRVRPEASANFSLSEENSWVEVKNDFYNKLQPYNSNIGVKFNNLDIYKKKFWGLAADKGQTFDKNVWNIDEVYDSKVDAEKANPVKQYTKEATIEKKKITQKGDYFFVINSEQRKMPVMVEEDTFNKYKVNDSISCEFESIGDLIKFIKIS